MMSMRRSRTRSRLISVLAVLATLGQLAVTVVAPLAESRAGQSAPAHVEEQGVTKHYAHNDAACVACTATTLLSLPTFARAPVAEIALGGGERPGSPERAAPLSALHDTSPRAPPPLWLA